MNETILKNIISFLERTELKWNEVPAFIECMKRLSNELTKKEESK